VDQCPRCQQFGRARRKPHFQSWEFDAPNDTVFADFLGPLHWPESEHSVHILLLIDGFSRFVQLTLGKEPTAETTIKGVREWTRRFGAPRRLVSDQGPAFVSSSLAEECNKLGIEHLFTGVEAHWSNGIAERAIGTILERIKRMGSRYPWKSTLHIVERAYNTTEHSSLRCPPHFVMTGTWANGEAIPPEEWEKLKAEAHKHDLERRHACRPDPISEPEFKVGQRVFLRRPGPAKLDPEWIGPFTVTGSRGNRLYELAGDQGPMGLRHGRHLRPVPVVKEVPRAPSP